MKRLVLSCAVMALAACAPGQPNLVKAPPVVATPVVAEKEKAPAPVERPVALPNGGASPAFSPDGSRIAFLSSTLHTPKDLWVANADGTGARRVTAKGVNAFRWGADGRSITVSARRKGYDEVLVIDLEGGKEKRIPGLPPNATMPLFSPDGALFAITVPGKAASRDLWIGTADGKRLEAVTENIGVRSLFWGPDSRTVYFETGKIYGMGIWKIDLAKMEAGTLLNELIGTPEYSPKSGLIAYPYPPAPGEFEVRTMKLDGSDLKVHKAFRLAGRKLEWDAAGAGVYYLGQDKVKASEAGTKKGEPAEEKDQGAPHKTSNAEYKAVGVTALWHLDLATGVERRVSPAGLHLVDFTVSGDGRKIAATGLLDKSFNSEVFILDASSGQMEPLIRSRVSSWGPVLSTDSKIAFFTNEAAQDTIKIIDHSGAELASYPGFMAEGDSRLHWLPGIDGLMIFSSRGLHAFSESGEVQFPNKADHRAWLYADASIQGDKVLLSAIPRYGESPGLYLLEAVEGKFKQTDLRYPSAPEVGSDVYLQPRWSMDGQKIAFSDGIDIWTMKADGSSRIWITDYAQKTREEGAKPSFAAFPVWSVNGDKICYSLTVFDGQDTFHELWVTQADGKNPKKVYSETLDSQFQALQPEYTYQPFFDVTGERLIFTAAPSGIPNLFSVDLASGDLHQLTETGAIFPALDPDEGAIIYTSLEGNEEALWTMNTDGTGKKPFVIKPRKVDPEAEAASAKESAGEPSAATDKEKVATETAK